MCERERECVCACLETFVSVRDDAFRLGLVTSIVYGMLYFFT